MSFCQSSEREIGAYRASASRSSYVVQATKKACRTDFRRQLSAYDLARRSCERGSHITPAQIYRVLDRLEASGRIQRIELLSAWLPKQNGQQGFLVCRSCRSVQTFQIGSFQLAVQRICRAAGVSPSRGVFESWGLCADCNGHRAACDGPAYIRRKQTMPIKMKSMMALPPLGLVADQLVPSLTSDPAASENGMHD